MAKTVLLLAATLAILKLYGLLALPWLWVLFPLWLPLALFVGLLLFFSLAVACVALASLIAGPADDPHPPDRVGP